MTAKEILVFNMLTAPSHHYKGRYLDACLVGHHVADGEGGLHDDGIERVIGRVPRNVSIGKVSGHSSVLNHQLYFGN